MRTSAILWNRHSWPHLFLSGRTLKHLERDFAVDAPNNARRTTERFATPRDALSRLTAIQSSPNEFLQHLKFLSLFCRELIRLIRGWWRGRDCRGLRSCHHFCRREIFHNLSRCFSLYYKRISILTSYRFCLVKGCNLRSRYRPSSPPGHCQVSSLC